MTFLFISGWFAGFHGDKRCIKRTPPTRGTATGPACCAEVAAFGKARDKPKSETSRDFDFGNNQRLIKHWWVLEQKEQISDHHLDSFIAFQYLSVKGGVTWCCIPLECAPFRKLQASLESFGWKIWFNVRELGEDGPHTNWTLVAYVSKWDGEKPPTVEDHFPFDVQ